MNTHKIYSKGMHPIIAKEAIKSVNRRGYAVLEDVYLKHEIGEIRNLVKEYLKKHQEEEPYGIRELFPKIPKLREYIFNQRFYTIIKDALGEEYFLCKSIFFNKIPENNWYVSWHQDVPINVASKIEMEGFNSWTHKKGVTSVRPPLEYLQNIYTFRIHLDDTNEDNGVLKVIPKSHYKILSPDDIEEIRKQKDAIACNVEAGGINILKPLTLHSSERSKSDKSRRVIHLEFSSMELPNGMEWAERMVV
ncbi:MAG: phytanoyl-CoA dioxygenase family protein [Cyclobacteriaceae bacterium]|nr:phytanoyl-CoA dioxygenase family protein [Cyclobacteriaceae bacterium]